MTSNSTISETERKLLKYLSQSIKITNNTNEEPCLDVKVFEQIYSLADRHEILALFGNILDSESLPLKLQNDFQLKTAKTVHKGITLQSLGARLTALLEKEGITAVTLKGYAVARLYPVPEYRKTSDVDLFFFTSEDALKAEKILCVNGFKRSDEWHANHHSILISEKNELVELHSSWADDFKDKNLNKYLTKIQKDSINYFDKIDANGKKLYVYNTTYQAFYLLVHMLGHFVGGGFGLRNLCDWVVLWENCEDDTARVSFLHMTCDSGIETFAKTITLICIKYLGLSEKNSPFPYDTLTHDNLTDELLRDVLDAGEFGSSEPERMVGMDGSGILAYIKEFHHQMRINFPKAGKIFLFWPVLWTATLIRFLNNNKKYNRAPVSEIMKKAGSRGKLIKKIISNK